MEVFGLVAVFESEVLEERVCREGRREELVAEEARRVG